MTTAVISDNESFIGFMVLVTLLFLNLIIRTSKFYFGVTKVCFYLQTLPTNGISCFLIGEEIYDDVTANIEPSQMMCPELNQPVHNNILISDFFTSWYHSHMMASQPQEPLN
jgi:hypothetical protein